MSFRGVEALLGQAPGPMPQGVQSALKAAMNAQGGPNNPATPAYREEPEHAWFLALQRIRISAREATEHVGEEKGPDVKAFFAAVRVGAEQLMAGIDPKTVSGAVAADLIRGQRPDIAAQLDLSKQQPPGPPQQGGPPLFPPAPVPQAPAGGTLAPQAPPPAAQPPAPAA